MACKACIHYFMHFLSFILVHFPDFSNRPLEKPLKQTPEACFLHYILIAPEKQKKQIRT